MALSSFFFRRSDNELPLGIMKIREDNVAVLAVESKIIMRELKE